ncbi:MAG: phosphoribosylformylglycinamidine synthase subunit PurL [Thermovirgaceae bacterium]|nr:phosphoribosylformylglycinamidine synthase subunit PurL [Thermovirgaceae bacterium]
MKPDFREVGLKESEYRAIIKILGREPNTPELRILGVMWSEHCSYKSTRPLLAKFPNTGGAVVQGPGENAGIVDAGGGWGVAFKVESHNHPSAVAPFQGAATGVGGIIRDILAMGARPVATLDGLCLGDGNSAHTRSLAEGIVKGIAGYGNAVGVPTVGGKTIYDGCYNGNPLVNAMCVGIVPLDSVVSSKTAKPGQLAILVGSRTGRDGIAGAAFASSELTDDTRSSRPKIQIGDPFVEKLLIECCLDIHSRGLIVGMQDMGAAGITSSSSEIAAKSGTGIVIRSDLVPLREENMKPWEIALSESQERMLLIAEPENLPEIERTARKWELECAPIGEITDDGLFVIMDKDEMIVSLPAGMVGGSCPVLPWPSRKPAEKTIMQRTAAPSADQPGYILDQLLGMLGDPNLADKSEIYHQYDYMVQTNTVIPPGSGISVIRIRENGRLIGLTMEVDPWKCDIDPFTGAAETFLKALRPLWVSGAEHLAMTNCLNYPSPENPENFWVLSRSVEGFAAVARDLVCPVVSGNVSLYNESTGSRILPSPLVGVVGLYEKTENLLRESTLRDGDLIFLAGTSGATLNGSHLARRTGMEPISTPFDYLPEREVAFMRSALKTSRENLASSGRAIAGGGLLISMAKTCIASGRGIRLDIPVSAKLPELLFGEGGARALYSVPPSCENQFISAWSGIPVIRIGEAGGSELSMGTVMNIPLHHLEQIWRR